MFTYFIGISWGLTLVTLNVDNLLILTSGTEQYLMTCKNKK